MGFSASLPLPWLMSPHSKLQWSSSQAEQLIAPAPLIAQNREWLVQLIPLLCLFQWIASSVALRWIEVEYFLRLWMYRVEHAGTVTSTVSKYVHRTQRPRRTTFGFHLCSYVIRPQGSSMLKLRRWYSLLSLQAGSVHSTSPLNEPRPSDYSRWVL